MESSQSKHGRRWLQRMPRLQVSYLAWINAWRVRPWRQSILSLAVVAGWSAMVAGLGWASGDAGSPGRVWIREQALLLAGIVAVAGSMLVVRRRAALKQKARRLWISALPVRPMAAFVEKSLIETAPLLIGLLAVAAAWFAAWAMTILSGRAWPAPLSVGVGWILGGLGAGAVLGRLVPLPRPEELPPGSRYVPQPRPVRVAVPRGSLAALGIWPVRQMFASARPKAVAQTLVPVLVMMPLGTQADAALVVIGIFAATGSFLLLLAALVTVGRWAARWLRPLPVRGVDVASALVVRACGLMGVAVALDAALVWVLTGAGTTP